MKFKSKYTDKEISEAQVISERICEIIAKNKNKTLPYQFWQLPEWKKIFTRQILEANKLLKVYSSEAILLGISLPKNKRAYSLAAPFLVDSIDEEQRKIDARKSSQYETVEIQAPRPEVPKEKSILEKLNEI